MTALERRIPVTAAVYRGDPVVPDLAPIFSASSTGEHPPACTGPCNYRGESDSIFISPNRELGFPRMLLGINTTCRRWRRFYRNFSSAAISLF